MKEERGRNRKMREKAKEVTKDYLLNNICDYETIVSAIAEMLWEDFGIRSSEADDKAKTLIDSFWDDVVAEAEDESEVIGECYRNRESALRDAKEGRW